VRIRGIDWGSLETVSAGHIASRVIARQRNSADVRLGVKWSQVRILSARPVSARPESSQLRALMGPAWVAGRILAGVSTVTQSKLRAPFPTGGGGLFARALGNAVNLRR
jgi:hypothetical protein